RRRLGKIGIGQNACRDTAPASSRNHVAGERSAVLRIERDDAKRRRKSGSDIGEIARLEIGCRHRPLVSDAVALALPFVVEEEEGLVLATGTAGVGPEQIEPQLRLYAAEGGGPAVRVHLVVAEKLPRRSVQAVGPTLNRDIDHRAGAASIFGGITAG